MSMRRLIESLDNAIYEAYGRNKQKKVNTKNKEDLATYKTGKSSVEAADKATEDAKVVFDDAVKQYKDGYLSITDSFQDFDFDDLSKEDFKAIDSAFDKLNKLSKKVNDPYYSFLDAASESDEAFRNAFNPTLRSTSRPSQYSKYYKYARNAIDSVSEDYPKNLVIYRAMQDVAKSTGAPLWLSKKQFAYHKMRIKNIVDDGK